MTTRQPIEAAYLHVPFCRRRCGYCDFYSTVLDESAAGPVVEAMLSEMEGCARREDVDLKTAYVGGGTPTCLPAEELRRLLRAVRGMNGSLVEFTIEANPATVDEDTMRLLVDEGVDRISIGAQSFRAAELATLERIHGPEEIVETVELCRRMGLERISLDLIFGIPGQTLEDWRANLRAACELGPEHLSCYSLTYESGTRLHAQLEAGEVVRADEDLDADMYEATIEALSEAGYEHYEISNFARPGGGCRHNLIYWRNEPYLGIGPSAAGFVDGVRYSNVSDLNAYVDAVEGGRDARASEERRNEEQQARECAMLGLRLIEGLDRRRFAARFGWDAMEFFRAAVERNVELGLLETTDNHIRLSRRGLLLADRVVSDFL